MVIGQIMPVNPAAVRGPRHIVRAKGLGQAAPDW